MQKKVPKPRKPSIKERMDPHKVTSLEAAYAVEPYPNTDLIDQLAHHLDVLAEKVSINCA